MDLHSGYPYSLVKNGLPFDYPRLDKNEKAKVAIMGGGISGALVAYHLVNAGIDCLLFDGRTIGLGSTCASTSLLQYEIDVPLCRLAGKIGEANAARAYHLCGDAIHKLEAISRRIKFEHFERRQSLYYAAKKNDTKFLREELDARKKAGFDVAYLDQAAIKEKFKFKAPGGILSALGAQTNAYLMTHSLLQYCVKKGLRVFDRTTADKINHTKRGVTITTKSGCKISANKLVYATGYEAVRYIDQKIVDLQATYSCISEQVNNEIDFWKNDSLLWNTAKPYLYLRTTKDRRFLVGGRDDQFNTPTKRDELLAWKTKQLVRDFNKLFPNIPFKPEFSWAGTFGSTKDGLPFIGEYTKLPNGLFALGFGGNGITFSLIAAEMITALITGKNNQDEALFSFDRI